MHVERDALDARDAGHLADVRDMSRAEEARFRGCSLGHLVARDLAIARNRTVRLDKYMPQPGYANPVVAWSAKVMHCSSTKYANCLGNTSSAAFNAPKRTAAFE